MTRKIINIDEELDIEINRIAKVWQCNGFKNVKKPDVLRILINRYKEDVLSKELPPPTITRKPKSKIWYLL